MRERLQGYWAL